MKYPENLKLCRKLRSGGLRGKEVINFTTTPTPHLALSYLAKTGMEWNVLFKSKEFSSWFIVVKFAFLEPGSKSCPFSALTKAQPHKRKVLESEQ